MTIVSARSIIGDAIDAGTGVGAFNVITLEHAEAVVGAAEACGLPVIVQVSENALAFHGGDPRPLGRAVLALAESTAHPVALHLDHATSIELCKRAVDVGFGSVMFDASTLNDADNLAHTRAAADWAHLNDVWIEAELGAIGGKGGAHVHGVRTDPAEAAAFVQRTGVDALAVAVGSTHAMENRTAQLDHNLIARLHAAVTVPLVLHGSSGVPDSEISSAISAGMVKINVGTALNTAYTSALFSSLEHRGQSSDPRPHLAAARAATRRTVEHLLLVISS